MFIWNGIDNRMIDTVELTTVLPITGSMVRAAQHKSTASYLFPGSKQSSKLLIHIAKCSLVALIAVMCCTF